MTATPPPNAFSTPDALAQLNLSLHKVALTELAARLPADEMEAVCHAIAARVKEAADMYPDIEPALQPKVQQLLDLIRRAT